MLALKQVQKIWSVRPSGILVPAGWITDGATNLEVFDFQKLKDKAVEIENLYKKANIVLRPDSELGRMIQNTKDYCEFRSLGKPCSWNSFFLCLHLDRLAKAILPLQNEDQQTQCLYLEKLLSGTLDFFKREKSEAKSFLWELEVWSWLREKTKNVKLEEPDITVNYSGSRIGIACKKLYSEKHVQNVLSEGVGQIEKEFEFGIVAINIDELLPENSVLKAENTNIASEIIQKNNDIFLNKHSRHFEKYFSKSRIISTIISTSVLIDIPSQKPQFSNMYRRIVWTVSGLSIKHKEQLDNFYNTVMN
ncbi:MAG: hypothetical protein WCE45_03055 [Sedimentisphaerales bacterium]